MAVLLSRTQEKIIAELLPDVISNTSLTRTSPGSKLRTLCEAVSKQLGDQNLRMDINLAQAFLSGASGKYLDYIGELWAMPRLGRENVSIGASFQNVKFYVDTGTFGDINSGISILLPSRSVTIRTDPTGGVSYRLTNSVVLNAADSSQYVSVEAVQAGSRANLGSGQLVYHNFTGYTSYLADALKVTNEDEIHSGREVETDQNYRYRLSNALLAAEGANYIAIRLVTLMVPGVADLVMLPYHRGVGTFDIMIKSVAPRCPDSLLLAIRTSVYEKIGLGILGTIVAPKETGVSMEMTLRLTESISERDATTLISTVQRTVSEYVNNLDIGQELVVNEVVRLVMSLDNRIKDIGTASKPLDKFFVFKESELEDNKIRYSITDNYAPDIDERVIIETEQVTGDSVKVFLSV